MILELGKILYLSIFGKIGISVLLGDIRELRIESVKDRGSTTKIVFEIKSIFGEKLIFFKKNM